MSDLRHRADAAARPAVRLLFEAERNGAAVGPQRIRVRHGGKPGGRIDLHLRFLPIPLC